MPATIEVVVPTLADLAPAVARCAQPEGTGGLEQPALLRDAELRDGDPPHEPGVYVWSDPQGAVLYIGRAAGETWDLAKRLNHEQGLYDGYDPLGDRWEVSVIHLLRKHRAQPRWAQARTTDAAKEAERRLIEWHRALVGIAPVAVGWDVDPDTPKGQAQAWAQALWNETIPGGPLDPRTR